MQNSNYMIPLLPGDGIIYTGSTVFDRIEEIKLGSQATHFEVYIGNELVVTSLLAKGVGIYPQSTDQVLRVIRPVATFDLEAGLELFNRTIEGLPYGVDGLLNFTDQNIASFGVFCSQCGTEFFRGLNIEPFSGPRFSPSRKVAPMHFLYVSEKVFTVEFGLASS